MDLQRWRSAPGALASSALAVVSLIGGWTVAGSHQPAGVNWSAESISALAASTTPHRWIMTTALVLTGLAHIGTAVMLPRLGRGGRIALAAAGVATVGVAAAPLPAPGESTVAHTALAAASFGLLAVWPALGSPRSMRQRVVSGVLMLLVGSLLVPNFLGMPFGSHERFVAGALVLWPALRAWQEWWASGHRLGTAPFRLVLSVGLVAAASVLGGVAATAVLPAEVSTRHYTSRVQLSVNPGDATRLVARTTVGDVVVSFNGFAPGISATPQVRESITDVLSKGAVGVDDLQPGADEINDAVGTAVLGLGWRFALGALVVAGLFVAASAVVRRDRPTRRACGVGVVAALIACVGTGLTIWQTYQPDRQRAFATTGVLGTIQANANLLKDVEARSAQVTPYVRNLIAISTALRDKYVPSRLDQADALRVLLVSDVHGANQYPLMRSVVASENIDLVVDTGDLANFGTVAELDAAGLPAGIASLGVPYLFVRGNHDAASATDSAVLSRLAKVRNVVLLQPNSASFTRVEAGGIRIAGFNDPRWFGDDGKRSAAKQEPAKRAFEAAMDGRPRLDLLVSHEPWAVQGAPADVAVNGHMHTPHLEGNRVQAGTFTGGGPLTHFQTSADSGEELVGQPFAYDVLAFGEDCVLTSLTRYRYRNLIQGRPAYDNISLVNGSQVESVAREAETRTCTRPVRDPADPRGFLTLESVPARP